MSVAIDKETRGSDYKRVGFYSGCNRVIFEEDHGHQELRIHKLDHADCSNKELIPEVEAFLKLVEGYRSN